MLSASSAAVIGPTAVQLPPRDTARRRKVIPPTRSASRDDLLPGVIFKIGKQIHVVSGDGLTAEGDGGDKNQMPLQASGNGKSASVKILEAWDWRVSGLASGSTTSSLESQKRLRQRSNSLNERMQSSYSSASMMHSSKHRQGSYAEQSDSESESGPSPTKGNLLAKRRASIAETGIQGALSNPAGTGSNAMPYSGSLAHLVPNTFLQTTSRRVSTHGNAAGCICTSCGSTMTPYWRDGWATNVMLCNACGLRFQKFARRCPSCMYIPRKEDSLGEKCVKCSTAWVVGPG